MSKKDTQQKGGLGCLPAKKDIRDFRLNKKIALSCQYPTHFECEHRSKIKNQGIIGSCVAHSVAEILEYHDNMSEELSTNFLYGIHYKLFGSVGPGMYLREACKIAKDYGDPAYKYCPGNYEVTKVYDTAAEAFEKTETLDNAALHRISKYIKLKTFNELKYALMEYGPVLASINWYDDNKVDKKTGIITKGTIDAGGHAIVILGWDEKGWLAQNSWGTAWGKKGYFTIPYDYKITEAYSLIIGDDKAKNDIQQPVKCAATNIFYKIINWILNLF